MKHIFDHATDLCLWLEFSEIENVRQVCKAWNEDIRKLLPKYIEAQKTFLTTTWPILDLVDFERHSNRFLMEVATDIRQKRLLDLLQVEYSLEINGWQYSTSNGVDPTKFLTYHRFEIPDCLARADSSARPWRSKNMEARGWGDVDSGEARHSLSLSCICS